MKLKKALKSILEFNYGLAFARLMGTALCAGAICLPVYLPLHPQLVNPYYGLMLWTGGLLIIHRAHSTNR